MAEILAIALLLGLCLVIIAGLPAVGLWWLARWLKRRNYRRTAVATQILLACFGAFCFSIIYSFYFPFESEFKGEFRQLTGLPFPKSGEVIGGKMSGLDIQGDYYVNAQVVVERSDYQYILNSIRSDPAFHTERIIGDTASTSYSRSAIIRKTGRFHTQTFSKDNASEGRYESISFLPDQRTISFHRSQN